MTTFNDFPLQIASGVAFCNRVEERKKLKKLLLTGQHVWLQAHRRHGKSSLLLTTFDDLSRNNEKFTFAREDLAFASDRSSVIEKLCNSASALIIETLNKANTGKKADFFGVVANKLTLLFNRYSPNFSLYKGAVSMKFGKEPSLEMLNVTLSKLNEISKEYGVRSIFMIDEFQQLSKVDNNTFDIEGVIRHNLELATNVTYVLCGSERGLMEQALGDVDRPLYKHVYQFKIERIARACYFDHVMSLWKARWEDEMNVDVFDYVIDTTQRHPYYVNYLFAELWIGDCIPTLELAEKSWKKIVEEELSRNKKMILDLKNNEKKVLRALALKPTKEVQSSRFVKLSGVASGSMGRTISQLMDKDLTYYDSDLLTIVSPALAAIAVG
ncbi:MAG: hypothetical protein Q9M92_17725 [Enterobacterales bacterium]|nr:hypothetical protein [Enterobacterales bacterium]